jgi:hypothetical protein
VPSVNYDYPDDDHQRWKLASTHRGQTLKEWIRRALNAEAERQETERAEEERRRRSR